MKGFVPDIRYVGCPYKEFVLELFREYDVTVIAMQKVGIIMNSNMNSFEALS